MKRNIIIRHLITPPYLAVFSAVFAGILVPAARAADPLPQPVLYETMDDGSRQSGALRVAVEATGSGKIGQAGLVERRTVNLLTDASFADAISNKSAHWILLNGAEAYAAADSGTNGYIELSAGAAFRQIIEDTKADQTGCFSVYARAVTPGSKLSLEWSGAQNPNAQEFTPGTDWQRIKVSGKTAGGSITPTVKCISGKVDVSRPQFETGISYPTSFITKEKSPRGVDGVSWEQDGKPVFKGNQGTVSMWINPEWVGETADSGFTLLYMAHDPKEAFNQAHSYIALNSYIKENPASPWQYAMNLLINDKSGQSHPITIPWTNVNLTPGWHNIAVVWNLSEAGSSYAAIYWDGAEVGRADSMPLQGMDDMTVIKVGAGGGGYLDGWLDEVRIYDKALSPDMIQQLAHPSA